MNRSKEIFEAYLKVMKNKIESGFRSYQITFMFNPLNGGEGTVRLRMNEAVQRTYSHLLTRVMKRVSKDLTKLPLWVYCQDWPVHKKKKKKKTEVIINDGCHVHAFVLLPPNARPKFDLVEYIDDNQQKLIGLDGKNSVMSIHAVEVTETPDVAADYVIKSLDRKRIDAGEIECLPLSRREMTTLSNAERRDRAAKFNADKIASSAENDNVSVQLRESQVKLRQLQRRLRNG